MEELLIQQALWVDDVFFYTGEHGLLYPRQLEYLFHPMTLKHGQGCGPHQLEEACAGVEIQPIRDWRRENKNSVMVSES